MAKNKCCFCKCEKLKKSKFVFCPLKEKIIFIERNLEMANKPEKEKVYEIMYSEKIPNRNWYMMTKKRAEEFLNGTTKENS